MLFDSLKERASERKFEQFVKNYSKLSSGKIGTVEQYKTEDGNTTVTTIHTENGPFVKKEVTYYGAKNPDGSKVPGTSVSYTGIRTILDNDGKETLAFIDGAELGISNERINYNHDHFVTFNTCGLVETEKGTKLDLKAYKPYMEGRDIIPDVPTDKPFAFVQSIGADFEKELKELEKTNNPEM